MKRSGIEEIAASIFLDSASSIEATCWLGIDNTHKDIGITKLAGAIC